VLEPLAGYLLLGAKLLEGKTEFAEGWNFGPDADGGRQVQDVMDRFAKSWTKAKFETPMMMKTNVHEAHLLQLDSSKARMRLGWTPRLTFDDTVKWTAGWYRAHYEQGITISMDQLSEFEGRA
jgi:CDP-glucose 4,6-dehydratase